MENKDVRIVPLKELLDGSIRNGYSPLPADNETGYWVLGLGALGDDGIKIDEIKPVAPHESVLSNILNVDDFLVSRSNTPDKVGRSIRFRGEIENCSYPDLMMRFRIDEQKADVSYIEQMLKSSGVRAYFKSCAAGSSSTMVKINKGVLEKTPISIPKLEAQKKIAQILLTWDQAITATEQLLANSQQQKKALMQQLLTGKKRLLDENGVVFSGEWKSTKVKEIFKPEVLSAGNQDFPIFSVTKNGLVNQSEYFNKSVASEDTSKYRVVKTGRFVMSGLNFWMGSVDVHLMDFPVSVSPAYKVFVITNLSTLEFMKHFIRSSLFQKVLEAASVVGASVVRRNFSESIFNNYELFIPEIAEQEKIAAVLSAAEQDIEGLQKNLECLKQEKKALMQQLLTGKRRVKVDA
jgi:type I restriction enzyme S subunit